MLSSPCPARHVGAPRKIARVLIALAATLPAIVTACGGDNPAGPDNNSPGIHVVAGANIADTVNTTPAQALIVRVLGVDRQPVSGAVVRFNATEVKVQNVSTPTMGVGTLGGIGYSRLANDTTDASGQASVRVQFGSIAGNVGIVVAVPDLGYIDTIPYTIKPGNATRLVMQPKDTAVFVGRTFGLRGVTLDRVGNVRTDRVTYTLSNSHASVSGTTLAGRSVGRVRLTARVGSLSDTAAVSVVPRGTIAVYTSVLLSGQHASIYTLDLDGSNLRQIVQSPVGAGYAVAMPPVWSPDGKSIFYHDGPTDSRVLMTVDVGTGVARRVADATNQLRDEVWPELSPDGQWLYYNGSKWGDATLYRIRANGTGREQVSPSGTRQFRPSLSRDGTRVVAINGIGVDDVPAPLEVMTLATKAIRPLAAVGVSAAWSPNDDRIAFVTGDGRITGKGQIDVVNADGSGLRTVAAGPGFYDRLDWSPDGKYLIAVHNAKRLVVVDVVTGEEMPVYVKAGEQFLVAPAWKR